MRGRKHHDFFSFPSEVLGMLFRIFSIGSCGSFGGEETELGIPKTFCLE